MSLISLIVHGQYAQLLLSAIVLLFMFYALGRIIQQKFRYNKSNIYIAIPLGLISYMLLNQLIYTPIILTGLGINILLIIDTIKAISLLLFIIISYEYWLPSFNLVNLKSVGYSLLSITIVLTVYIVLAEYISTFANTDLVWVSYIDNIYTKGVYEKSSLVSVATVIENYQSTYYWIYINSNFGSADTATTVNIEIGSIFIVAVSLAIQAALTNHEKTFTSVLFATVMSVLVAVVLGFQSPTNDMFYTTSISIIIMLLIYDYASKESPSDNIITIGLFTSTTFITVGGGSLAYIFIFGLTLIILNVIRGGNIVRNTIHFLMLVLLLIVWYVIALFIYDLAFISTAFVYLLILLGVFSIIFLPLYSIGYTQSRREELVNFEKSIQNKIGIIVIIITSSLILLLLFVNWINDVNIVELLNNFFKEFNTINDAVWMGVLLYFGIILVPSILITVFWFMGKRNILLTLFAFVNILVNPIAITSISSLLNTPMTGDIILIPSMLIIAIFMIKEFVNRVPLLH